MKNLKVKEVSSNTKKEDIPKVCFHNFDLQIEIGKWLGILESDKSYKLPTLLSKYNFSFKIEKMLVPRKKRKEIEFKFRELLYQIGLEESFYYIKIIDIKLDSIHISLEGEKENIDILLQYGIVDWDFKLISKNEKEKRIYRFIKNKMQLELLSYTCNNAEHGNLVEHEIHPELACFKLKQNGKYLSIQIEKPSNKKFDYTNGFRIQQEQELNDYLLSLSFPIQIEQVYRKICEILNFSIEEYPTINIVNSMYGKGETDLISIKKGILQQFMETQNGRKISIDGKGNWTYTSETVSASSDGFYSFHTRENNPDKLNKVLLPSDDFHLIEEEVKKFKIFVKSIF